MHPVRGGAGEWRQLRLSDAKRVRTREMVRACDERSWTRVDGSERAGASSVVVQSSAAHECELPSLTSALSHWTQWRTCTCVGGVQCALTVDESESSQYGKRAGGNAPVTSRDPIRAGSARRESTSGTQRVRTLCSGAGA